MLRVDGPIAAPLLMVTTKTIRVPARRRGRYSIGTSGRNVSVSNSKYRLYADLRGILKGTKRAAPTGGVFQPDPCKRCYDSRPEMRSYRDQTTRGRGPRFRAQKQFLTGFLAASPQGCGRILEVNGTLALLILNDSSKILTLPLRSLRLLPAKKYRKKCQRSCAKTKVKKEAKVAWTRFPVYVPETERTWRISWELFLDILLERLNPDVELYMSTLRRIFDHEQENQEVNPCICNGPLEAVIRLAGFTTDPLRIDGEKAFLFPRIQLPSSSAPVTQSFVPVPGIVPHVSERLPPPTALVEAEDYEYRSGYRARRVQFPPRLSQKDLQTGGGNLIVRGMDVRQVARARDYAIVACGRGFPFVASASLGHASLNKRHVPLPFLP